MKLAIAQINTTVGDLEGNIARILDAARSVADQKPDLIVYPELTVCGYPPRDILYDASFVEAVQAATVDLARQAKDLPPLLVGSFAPAPRKIYEHPSLNNIACLMQNGDMTIAQIKQLLPVYDVFYEPRWFLPGEKTLPPIEIAGTKVGVMICEDMWDEEYPVHPGADLKAMGAEMLICISASPYRRGAGRGREYHARRQVVSVSTSSTQRIRPATGSPPTRPADLPLVFVNLVGGNDELIFDGGSFMLEGEKLKEFEEEVKVLTVDDRPQTMVHSPSSMVGEEEIFRALTLGLRDFADKNRLKHAVIGLSGGIDSSVAAAIAAEALGSERVTGVAIPSRFTDPRSTESARELAERLGIGFEVIEMEKMHKTAEQVLGAERSAGVGGENIQARLRMIVLMSFVNQRGGFLINTSNKTELTLGYGTLYGDLAGTISPLGDLTKVEVYEVARWVNSEWKVESGGVIPDFVMTRKPSAELRADQVDPFDYERISPEVESLVQKNQSNAAMRTSEHKRWQAGVILKVSEKSFGRGRLMPITRK
jgi:NAD+ synthase (glutamine-hydrolysing)